LPKGDKQRGPRRGPVSYTAAFTQAFLDDRAFWARTSPNVAQRLDRLVRETVASPITGIGKPEALKENLQGYWSRRLTEEHRILYRVEGSFIIFVSAKDHY
jgi:toxin YoeB